MAETLNVVATKPGIYGNVQKAVGAKFAIKNLREYSHNWMKPVGWEAPPKAPLPRAVLRPARFGPSVPSGRLHPGVRAKAEAAAKAKDETKVKVTSTPEAPPRKPARK